MSKIIIVFDIDDTLFFSFNFEKSEWVGSKALWLDLCLDLKNKGLEYNIEICFAIATSKSFIDEKVIEVGNVFSDYLIAIDTDNHRTLPVINNDWLYLQQEDSLIRSHLYTNKDKKSENSAIVSSIHVARGPYKSHVLKKIAKMHGVSDYSNVFMVDDYPVVLDEAQKHGYSTISADGICIYKDNIVFNKDLRTKNVSVLINTIKETIEEKCLSIKKGKSNIPIHKESQVPQSEFSMQKESARMITNTSNNNAFFAAPNNTKTSNSDNHLKPSGSPFCLLL